ncbi:MAG: substrate-binding domain-containing protein [Planctomycetota bacterium]|nr:substrate-binding domain-containing protein [Planctomycetota bacterium]
MKSPPTAHLFLAALLSTLASGCSDTAQPLRQSKDGKWRIVWSAQAGDWHTVPAANIMSDALDMAGHIDLVFAHSDMMAHAAYVRAQEHGRTEIQYVSIGALPSVGRRYLLEGELTATIEYATCAAPAIDLALLLCNGVKFHESTRNFELGTRIWTRETMASGGRAQVSPDQIALDALRRQHAGVLTTQPATDEIFRIGMSQHTAGAEWQTGNTAEPEWQTLMREDLQAAAGRYPQIEFTYRAAGDVDEQAGDVREFMAQNYHAILVSPLAGDALTATCREAIEQGIHIVAMGQEPDPADCSVFVGNDNELIGRVAGEEIKKLLPDGGAIVEILGPESSPAVRERDKGFNEALGLAPPK